DPRARGGVLAEEDDQGGGRLSPEVGGEAAAADGHRRPAVDHARGRIDRVDLEAGIGRPAGAPFSPSAARPSGATGLATGSAWDDVDAPAGAGTGGALAGPVVPLAGDRHHEGERGENQGQGPADHRVSSPGLARASPGRATPPGGGATATAASAAIT